MGAGHYVVRLVACLVGRECTRESNVVRYVRYIESISLQLYVITFLIGFLVNGSCCLCPNLGSLESRFAAKPNRDFLHHIPSVSLKRSKNLQTPVQKIVSLTKQSGLLD